MTIPSPRAIRTSALLAALLLGTAALAQPDTTLLRGKAVTEANVLDALTPPPPGEEPIVTRSLRVSPDGSASPSAGVLAPRKKPSASLLITFATNSSELTARAREQLDVVAGALKNDRLKNFGFDVEGHADPRGSTDVNKTLSQQRAESVRAYLVTQHGIAEARLRAVGKGDSEPMNTRDIAAAENRRVTIITNAQ
jgi:outer membrane protein OmpA-like peptidoglycan-associated protein